VAKSLGAPNTHAFIALREIREAARAPVIHLESPPPVPGAHVVVFPGNFRDVIAQRGVAPDLLRYKLWRLNSLQYRDFCAASGIEYVPIPPEFQDANGMLAQAAWNEDPTHANPAYGASVLSRIAARFPA
jgi:PhoPQ-activated pathogenicity-related protein